MAKFYRSGSNCLEQAINFHRLRSIRSRDQTKRYAAAEVAFAILALMTIDFQETHSFFTGFPEYPQTDGESEDGGKDCF